jgi:hypothetical protein
MTGKCGGCGLEVDLTTSGKIVRHEGNCEHYLGRSDGGRSIWACSGTGYPPVKVHCPVCSHTDVKKNAKGRTEPHFDPATSLLCDGTEKEAATEVISQDKSVTRTTYRRSVITARPAYRPKIIARITDPLTGDVTVTVPEEKELCKLGTKPKANCVACGDMVYMTVTGRDRKDPPKSYEDWRDEHDRFGLPWAKERMLDHMKDKHLGVLDAKWKPLPVSSDEPPAPVPVSSMTLSQIFGVPAVPFLLGTVAFFIISLTSNSLAAEIGYMAGSVLYFIFSGLIIWSNVAKFRRQT